MNRKLTAKVQQIKSNTPVSVKTFSDILIIEPDNQTLLLKKGTIYTIFDLTSAAELNTQVVGKLIHDTLHNAYYQSENISPIQSLEKAISQVKENVLKMGVAEFNILAGVLWGNVMYIVQYGKAGSFLIRNGETKQINANAEGNFSAASGVVKDEDVIVFATTEFAQAYPPEKLLTVAIQPETLTPEAACLILKFIVDTSFSETESIDFGIKQVNKSKKPLFNFNIKLKKPEKLKITPILIIVATTVLLVGSIAVTLRKKAVQQTPPAAETAQETTTSQSPEPEPAPTNPSFDEATKTQTVAAETLYDIKITDSQANPTELAVLGNTLIATDKNTGKLFTSPVSTPKFTAEETPFAQITNLNTVGGKLNFTDSEGYKTYDLTSKKVTASFAQQNLGVATTYLDFVYAVSGNSIIKYTKETAKLSPSTWAQNDDFANARSLTIAVSIFVLKQDGTVVSYTKGVKDNFSVKGLPTPLNNPKQILTDLDWDNIYIADAGNKSVVILKKDGTYVKQIKHTNTDAWNDIRAIAVSADEKKLFVLSGSKVYKLDFSL